MVYVLLGTGFEEMEALAPIDLLRRAGIGVITVGLNGQTVYGGHNVGFRTDITIEEMDLTQLEMIVLPGGLGGVGDGDRAASLSACLRAGYDRHRPPAGRPVGNSRCKIQKGPSSSPALSAQGQRSGRF